MRLAPLIAAVCVVLTCTTQKRNLPPADRFYFPSGIHHERWSGGGEGVLYVISANFDRRFDNGTMTAVQLDNLGLPPFGSSSGAGGAAPTITNLRVDGGDDIVVLASFGGDLGTWHTPDGGLRMFIPSRAEGQKLMVVEARRSVLSCVATRTSDGGTREAPMDPMDCGEVGASLVELERTETGVPRADSPMSAAVSPEGTVWVTAGRHADSPRFSMTNFSDYVVHLPVDDLHVDESNFLGLGVGGTHAVVNGQRWTYFSGRFPSSVINPPLVRMVDRQTYRVFSPNLENDLKIGDARGIAVSSNERRLYVAARQASGVMGSDLLVVASITNPLGDLPLVTLLRTVPLAAEPAMVKTISRGAGREDLVVITCSGSGPLPSALVIYDEETQDVAAQLDGVGTQPSSFAIDVRPSPTGVGNGARIYVSNFGDGRVAVVDVPDLDRPKDTRVVAHLGASQLCLTRNVGCDAGVVP
jgi:hypothetical protein